MRKNLRRIRANSSATRMLAGLAVTLCLTSLAFADNAPPAPKVKAGEIIVKVAPGTADNVVRDLAAQSGCEYLRPVLYCPGFHVFRLQKFSGANANTSPSDLDEDTKTVLQKLKIAPGILSADPNYIRHLDFVSPRPLVPGRQDGQKRVTRATAPSDPWTFIPNDTLYTRQYGLPMIRMPEAWSIQSSARPVVVGVADTGIDIGHPDFATADGRGTRILGGRNFFPDDGTNVDANDYQDAEGHGTHVAGTIGATTNNATGVASVAGYNGGNVDVKFRIARVFGVRGGASDDIIYAGVGYLIDQNVDVINMSLGGFGTSNVERDTIARAISNNITVVAALGNESVDVGQFAHYPSSLPGVIAVSSVSMDKRLASYSNYGGNVAIAAPGGDVTSSSVNIFDQQIFSTWPRNTFSDAGITGYNAISGTSMATPHVAGAVALLLAAGAPRNPATIKSVLQSTALALSDDVPNNAGGNQYGAGLLDVYSALLTYADPEFKIGIVGGIDIGTYYASQLPSFKLRAIGVTKAPATGTITLEIQGATIPTSVVRPLVEGTDFTIPRTLQASQPKATVVSLNAPASGASLNLPPGRYKAVLKVGDQVAGTQFFEIVARTQPQGRALFSTPFKVRSVVASQPEQNLFTPSATFTLARYNPLRLTTDLDYALFQSSGRQDRYASFNAVASDNSPISYEINDPTTSVAPVGLGYWLNIDQSVTLNTAGPVATNAVAIKLYSAGGGWNMIGAPFVRPTAWGSVSVLYNGINYTLTDAITNNVISGALVGYGGGDYIYNIAPSGYLEPFQGYWVRALKDCTLIIAPTNSGRAVQSLVPTRQQPIVGDTSGWKARLIASVSGDRDGQNYFGQTATATDQNDILDVPKPPSGSGHAYVRFLTPTGEGRSVSNAFDLRSLNTKGVIEWNAAVSTDRANSEVTLTWDGIGSSPRRSTLTLIDKATGQTLDMRNRSSYTFKSGEAGSSRMITIKLSPSASNGPLAINNVNVSGGRSTTQAGVAVRFSVTAEAEITGAIKSLSGVKVGNLTGVSRAVAGGMTTLHWDGRSRSGSALPPGPYLLEITARSADGQTATFKQPVQMMH